MERLQVSNVKFLFNRLFSCREKSVRFKHHITLLSHYRVGGIIPKGFLLKFHCGTTEPVLQSRVDSTLRKCSRKLINLFEQHYKHKLPCLKVEERELFLSLKGFHPIEVNSIVVQLEKRTQLWKRMFTDLRLNKYARDGVQPGNVKAVNNNNKTVESPEEQQKHEPVNLTNQIVEQPLVELCSRGPSFVPTPTSIDWNSLQQGWQAFIYTKSKMASVLPLF
jgi:hypothetical protein